MTTPSMGGFTTDLVDAFTPPTASGCCSAPAQKTATTSAASPCCGTAAEAKAENSCCGSTAKTEAVAAGTGCCG